MNEDGAPESLVSLIGQLVEPPLPAPVPLTPQTWGWAVLLVLVLALAAWGLWRWARVHRANAYRREALGALAQAGTTAELAVILRRAALAGFPREDVASLTGTAWIAFLDRTGRRAFPQAAGAELRRAPYRDEAAAPSPELRAAAAHWLRAHRVTMAREARA